MYNGELLSNGFGKKMFCIYGEEYSKNYLLWRF